MKYLQPRPWHLIEPGTVVLIGSTPRTVQHVVGDVHGITVYAEGLPPFRPDGMYTQPVELDDADAIGNLHVTGLHPTPTEGNPS